jgi:hypothetical protein
LVSVCYRNVGVYAYEIIGNVEPERNVIGNSLTLVTRAKNLLLGILYAAAGSQEAHYPVDVFPNEK